jgi:hypothetical protein
VIFKDWLWASNIMSLKWICSLRHTEKSVLIRSANIVRFFIHQTKLFHVLQHQISVQATSFQQHPSPPGAEQLVLQRFPFHI